MIIFLSELQKEHLSLLHTHSTPVLVDFCKLVIDYIYNGLNPKKYCVAADKLNMSAATIQNLIYALTYLLVEACKHDLSESDFKSSIAIAGFSSEHQEVLVKLYSTKKAELSSALNLLFQNEPTYQDLTWRFEVQVASRNHSEEVKPTVSMDFVLMKPKITNQSKEEETRNKSESLNTNISAININASIQDAKAASQCQNVISHILVQCDLPNLLHMTNKLDQALKESKSQHVRKVQRAL